MWWRSAALALAVAGCGFAPAYGPAGPAAALQGRIAVETAETPEGFALRAALEDRLGGGGGPLRLAVAPAFAEAEAAVTPEGAITRYNLEGRASWVLSDPGGEIDRGVATAFTGWSAAGSAVAVRAAREDAQARLVALLAEEIVARLVLSSAGAAP
jgi:LPS-assembly lipoprotein